MAIRYFFCRKSPNHDDDDDDQRGIKLNTEQDDSPPFYESVMKNYLRQTSSPYEISIQMDEDL